MWSLLKCLESDSYTIGCLFPFFNIPLGTDDIQIIQRISVMPFLIVGHDSKNDINRGIQNALFCLCSGSRQKCSYEHDNQYKQQKTAQYYVQHILHVLFDYYPLSSLCRAFVFDESLLSHILNMIFNAIKSNADRLSQLLLSNFRPCLNSC